MFANRQVVYKELRVMEIGGQAQGNNYVSADVK